MNAFVSMSTAALFLLLGAVPAHAQSAPATAAEQASFDTATVVDPAMPRSTNAWTATDRRILEQAQASGQLEIHVSQLARERSEDKDVRELAEMVEKDHLALHARLMAAGAEGVPVETVRPARDPHVRRLMSSKGKAFDVRYLEILVRLHEQSITRFEAAQSSGEHSPAVRSLAREALPALRRHASFASSLKELIEND